MNNNGGQWERRVGHPSTEQNINFSAFRQKWLKQKSLLIYVKYITPTVFPLLKDQFLQKMYPTNTLPYLISKFDWVSRVFGSYVVFSQNLTIFRIDINCEIVEFNDKSVFHPVDKKLCDHYHSYVWQNFEQVNNVPLMLGEISNKNYIK